VKGRMFAKMRVGDAALIGIDDPWCLAIADRVGSGADVRRVSVLHVLDDGVSAPSGILHDRRGGKIVGEIDLRAMPALKGKHNWQNACMAYGAARALGVSISDIEAGMKSFGGLAHRMQQVGTVSGVPFINDSKATNADAAEKALASFDNIYWIAGGIAKSGGIEPLAAYFPKISKAYLIGAAVEDFAKTMHGKVNVMRAETLAKAVAAAASDAALDGRGNAVVLLSPACASFDQYKNFEIRGDAFVDLVSKLPGALMTVGGTT
jgi:UDP-N-acetylmuramoylalanine--D-glutamate ligase